MKRSDWFSKSFKVSHCSVINVLCFALLRQLDYFIKSLFVCQALFYFLNSVLSSLSCDSLFILSKCFSFVKNFFIFFCISVLRQKKAQGVGFEPTRPCGQTVFKTASLWPLRYPCTRAGDGNRTHVSSLEGWCSTIELHPRVLCYLWHELYLIIRIRDMQAQI